MVMLPERTDPLMEYGEEPPLVMVTVCAGSTPANAVPVSWARVGLLVALKVMVSQRVVWL